MVFFSVEKGATFSAKMPQIEPSMNLCLIWSPFWDKDLSNFKRELLEVSLCCFVVNFVTDSSKSTTQGEESFQTWAKSSKVFWSCQISITEEHFQPKRGVFTENVHTATTLAFDIKLHLVFIQNVCLIKDSAGSSVNFWKSSKDKLARSVWHYFWISHLLLFQIHFHLMMFQTVTFKNVF